MTGLAPSLRYRILVCSPCLGFQADSPYSTRMRALAMRSAGLDVTVYGFSRTYPLEQPSLGLPYHSLLSDLPARLSTRLECRVRHGDAFARFIVIPFLTMVRGIRLAEREGMDACFIADVEPWLTFLILWYCRLTRVHLPLAGMIPGNYVSMLTDWSLPLRTRIRNFLNYHLSRWIPGRMHVVGTSRQILETLGMADSPYARVVPEGHENLIGKRSQVSARSALGIPMGTRMLLLFGVASKAKGADLLFRAMEYVPPDFLVYVVGETGGVYLPSWGDVETLQQRGWSGKLKVISHFVSEDMMQDLYAACDAVVIPYRHGFAGTSTSLRRASEYGKVILACDQHHIGARVRERNLGLTFQTEDAMSLAATLREFVRQPEQWFKEVAERSRQLLQDESWEQVGLMYRDMFESIWAAKKYSCRETGRRM